MDHTLGHDVTLEVVPVESMDESNNESSLGFLAGFSRGQLFFGCVFCVLLVTRKKEVARKRIDISKTDSPRIDAKKTFISKTC